MTKSTSRGSAGSGLRASRRRLPLRFALAAGVLLVAGPVAEAQSFAVGAGASMVNDTKSVSEVRGFDTAAGHVFLEMLLEPTANSPAFEIRASVFSLPPTAEGGPNIKTESLTASVAYLFREEWFRAGFIGGIGIYRLTPKPLEAGQIRTDTTESVFGWNGGLLAAFQVTRRIELRLEATAAFLDSAIERRPILLGGGLAYRF